MSKCSICAHTELPAIESALASGTFKKDVAAQFGASVYALSRHVKHSSPASAHTRTSQDELVKWLSRADDQYLLAVADADQRGAVAALVAGLRAVEARLREEERAAESEQQTAGTETPVTLEEIDRIVQSALNETPRGRALNLLYGAPDRAVELAARLADNPASWDALESILESTQVN